MVTYPDGRLTGDCCGDEGLLWLRNWLVATDLGGPVGYPPTTGWLGIIITFSGPPVICYINNKYTSYYVCYVKWFIIF